MRLTVTSQLTLDGVVQSNGKPEPELNDGFEQGGWQVSYLAWNNSTLLQGDVAEEVAKLKRRPGNELQVHGTGTLVRTLMEHDLVDEYRLFIHPVVLGNGNRLFADGITPTALELTDTKTTGLGIDVHDLVAVKGHVLFA